MPTVYLLRNPENNNIYYVGYTIQAPSKRLLAHISSGTQITTQYLVSNNLAPIIEIIEEGEDVTKETETYYIKHYYSKGHKLENIDQVFNYQAKAAQIETPLSMKDKTLTRLELMRTALHEILKELPLSSSIPIVKRIKNICETALSK